ncbi:unnamed protein product, partial [Rotaria magnacalcarata]
MSDEVKADVDSQSDEINQRDEKSEELIRKLPVNDDEENELELLTPNGRETPSATSYSDIIIHKLVEGDFDLDKNYIIQKPKNLAKLFSILNKMSSSLQAEILSVLIGIMRKSERNLLACIDANIYYKLFELLNDIDDIVADLLVDILTVLTSLTINVNELKVLLRYLKTDNNVW